MFMKTNEKQNNNHKEILAELDNVSKVFSNGEKVVENLTKKLLLVKKHKLIMAQPVNRVMEPGLLKKVKFFLK